MNPRTLLAPILSQFAPPPELTVSAWADAERILPDTSAEPGRWRTSRVPYMREPMEQVTDPAVTMIVIQASAQVGKSETLLNVLGYHIAHDPCPMLLVQPTIDMAEAFSKDRLAKSIESTPALAAKVREGRGPASESTLRHKVFAGGFLALAGANSAASLAQRAVRLLLCDDLDRFPAELEDEGDPVDLAIKRTTTFWNRKVLLVSTPTITGGRIDTWYQRSDRRRFFVPCPRCGRMDYLAFSDTQHLHVVFEGRDPETAPASAHLRCPAPESGGCGGRIEDHERVAMVAQGEWRPTATAKEAGCAGYHVWEAYSPWSSLREIVGKFLSALDRGRAALKVFVNTTLGEAFEEQTQRVEPVGLLARREGYGPEGVEVPTPACCLVAGVDTQDNRFEVLVLAYGPGEEKWVVDWRQVPGDPKQAETKAGLLDALTRRYRHAVGVSLPILAACIDSGGHRTDDVYDFVLAHQHLRIYATIGRAGLSGKPLVSAPSEKRYGRSSRPVPLRTINVDDAKARVLSDLALPLPAPGCRAPGAWHLPRHLDTVDEGFVHQLTAEQLVTRRSKVGVAYQVWVQIREANHALDCAVLALAALRLLNPNLADMARRVQAAADRVPEASPAPAPPQADSLSTTTPAARPVGRSSYLGANRREGGGW